MNKKIALSIANVAIRVALPGIGDAIATAIDSVNSPV